MNLKQKEVCVKSKKNCWEIKQCGRNPGGVNVDKLGVCPTAQDTSADGLNGGKNGGRICWAVVGTLCGEEFQGTFVDENITCLVCDFFKKVREDEGDQIIVLKPGQTYKRDH